jgi:hypothetical protein
MKPIARTASVMDDGKDSNRVRGLDVDDRVGEAQNGHAANAEVWRDKRNANTRVRVANQLSKGGIYSLEVPLAEAGLTLFVPLNGVAELGAGLVFEANRLAHRRGRLASIERRTSSQAVPSDWPDRTLRARRSISSAQAASMFSSAV